MGHQATQLTQVTGTSSFTVNVPSDRKQLLLTIQRRNGQSNSWLSPVGWVDAERGTLLDCRTVNGNTQIDLPDEFARTIEDGDTLTLSCYRLGIEGATLNWKDPAKASKGLLGRFRAKPVEAPVEEQSQIEVQAVAAKKAAESMRAKVEEAQRAQAAAHERAQEAARVAEVARLAEEARIAEMKAAAVELERAEELRLQEEERLEDERRKERERRLEEARRAEEARLREEARRKKAALKAKLKDLTEQRDSLTEIRVIAKNDVNALEDNVKDLSRKAERSSSLLGRVENKLSKTEEAFQKRDKQLIDADAKTKTLEDQTAAINQDVEKASTVEMTLTSDLNLTREAHKKATIAAEEAIAHAESMKLRVEQVNTELQQANTALNKYKNRQADIDAAAISAYERNKAAKDKYAQAQADVEAAKTNFETAKAEEAQLQQALETRKSEHAEAMSTLEAVQAKERTVSAAISLINKGADMESVETLLSNTAPPKDSANENAIEEVRSKPSLFGGFKRKAAAAAAAPAATLVMPEAIAEVATPAPAPKKAPVVAVEADHPADLVELNAENDTDTSNVTIFKDAKDAKTTDLADDDADKNGKRKGLYASVSGIALLAIGAFALTQIAPTTSANANIPSTSTAFSLPTSAQTTRSKAEMTSYLPKEKAVDIAAERPTLSDVKAAAAESAAKAVETAPAIKVSAPEVKLASVKPETPSVKKKATETAKVITKVATAKPTKTVKTAALDIKLPKAEIAAPVKKTVKVTKTAAVKAPAFKQPQTKVTPKASKKAAPQASVKTIAGVQSKLTMLGFYEGAVTGQTDAGTAKAIVEYKSLLGLKTNGDYTTEFLTALDNSIANVHAQNEKEQQARLSAEAPRIEAQLPQPSITAAPVMVEEAAPAPVVRTASLTPIDPAPVADAITPVKRIKGASGAYPSLAIRRGFTDDVMVVVSYDVSETGSVINPTIKALGDTPPTLKSAFERAGLNSVKRMKFEPKTVNGKAVVSKGTTSRITFRTKQR